MNLKVGLAYVKFILSRTLLPYKSATRDNRTTVTGAQVDRATRIKSLDGH